MESLPQRGAIERLNLLQLVSRRAHEAQNNTEMNRLASHVKRADELPRISHEGFGLELYMELLPGQYSFMQYPD